MAHFKRGKCRRNGHRQIRGSRASWRAKVGLDPRGHEWHPWRSMMESYPAAWDRIFHTRPFRAAVRRLECAILKGADPDGLPHPVWGKPHIYYW